MASTTNFPSKFLPHNKQNGQTLKHQPKHCDVPADHLLDRARLKELECGARVYSIHIIFTHNESVVSVVAGEACDLGVIPRLLLAELIAREN